DVVEVLVERRVLVALRREADEEAEVLEERNRAAEAQLATVEAGAPVERRQLVRHERHAAAERGPTRACDVVDDAGLRAAVAGAEAARRHVHLRERVRRYFHRLRRARAQAADRHAVHEHRLLARAAAADRATVVRLDDARLENDDAGRVVERQLVDLLTRHDRARRHLVARHERVALTFDGDRLQLHRRLLQREVDRLRLAREHALLRHYHCTVADALRAHVVDAGRHFVDEVVAVVVRDVAEGRSLDRDLRRGDGLARLIHHATLDLSGRRLGMSGLCPGSGEDQCPGKHDGKPVNRSTQHGSPSWVARTVYWHGSRESPRAGETGWVKIAGPNRTDPAHSSSSDRTLRGEKTGPRYRSA